METLHPAPEEKAGSELQVRGALGASREMAASVQLLHSSGETEGKDLTALPKILLLVFPFASLALTPWACASPGLGLPSLPGSATPGSPVGQPPSPAMPSSVSLRAQRFRMEAARQLMGYKAEL